MHQLRFLKLFSIVSEVFAKGKQSTEYDHEDLFQFIGMKNISYFGHRLNYLIVKYEFEYTYESNGFTSNLSPTVTYFTDPIFFNCYIFSLNFTDFQPDYISASFTLFADNFERIPIRNWYGSSSIYKFAIFIGTNNTLLSDNEHFIVPGQSIEIDMSLSYNRQLPAPYGSCLKTPIFNSLWTINGQKLNYSPTGCAIALAERELMDSFGCILLAPVLGHKNTLSHLNSCFNFNISIYDLYERFFHALNLSKNTCLHLCEEVTYHQHVTSHPWLHANDLPVFYDEYIRNREFEYRFVNIMDNQTISNMNSEQLGKLYALIKDNFATVSININLKDIVVYKEVPQFSFTSFIGALGGILNLYSGISFIFVIELADFLLSSCLKRCQRRAVVP